MEKNEDEHGILSVDENVPTSYANIHCRHSISTSYSNDTQTANGCCVRALIALGPMILQDKIFNIFKFGLKSFRLIDARRF